MVYFPFYPTPNKASKLLTSFDDVIFASIQFNHIQHFLLDQDFNLIYQSSRWVISEVLYAWNYENQRKGHISQKKTTENFKKQKNAFQDNHMLTSWFKFQLDSSSGVCCSESAYTNTYIHSHSMNTEGPLFYYYMFICASFGSKISGFQKYECYAIMTNPHFT